MEFCLIFSLIFMLKLDKPFRNQEIFIISFSNRDFDFSVNLFFAVFGWFYTDPDPGSQSLADPDPKHCYKDW